MALHACGLLWAARDFLGPDAWLDKEPSDNSIASILSGATFGTSTESNGFGSINGWPSSSLCMAVGLFTRVSSALSWLMMLMVCHRMTGTLFGLDQVVMMLSMYLMLSDCGSVYSLDRKFFAGVGQSRWWLAKPGPTGRNRIATRLLQLHLCVVYLFGGISKLRGEMWWDGSALWFAAAVTSTVDRPDLDRPLSTGDRSAHARHDLLGNVLLCVDLATAHSAMDARDGDPRPRRNRHVSGMITFGTMMIVANLSFVEPATMRRIFQVVQRWRGQAYQVTEPQSAPNHR